MNYIQHLNQFLKKVEKNEAVRPTHISLYLSLFHLWNQHHFQNPIAATRTELMRVSKISAKTTFHNCIRDLVAWNWIEYIPSTSIYKGSSFRLIPFTSSPKNGLGSDTSAGISASSNDGTRVEPEVIPYIQTKTNDLNLKNNKSISKNLKNYNEEL